MSYVKYREDDIKIYNDRIFMRKGSQLSTSKKPTHYYECKYCHHIFTSKSELICHIRDIHNIVRPLIVINDKVVGDHTVLQCVHQAKILMYGFDGDIQVGSEVLRYGDDDEIDITSLLKEELSHNTSCKIIVNNAPVMIEYHPLSLDDNSLVKETIDDWQRSVSEGIPLNTSHLSLLDGGDLLFAQGVCNYYLACTAKHHKASRYDDAFAALSQFQDLNGLGKCILKAIAFRRNWVDTLRLLSDGEYDIFTTACDYFNNHESSFAYEEEDDSNCLFVEDSIQMSLEMIVLFQKGKYSEVKNRLQAIGNLDNLDDSNLIEQMYLLKARIAVAEGNHEHALRYYDKLISPAFRAEYRQFQKR